MSSERNYSIDQAAGLMLICVMVMHTLNWVGLQNSKAWCILQLLLFYRMPWFFFRAGMFSKPSSNGGGKNYSKKLIVPFIAWGFLSVFVECIRCAVDGKDMSHIPMDILLNVGLYGSFPGNSALWFFVVFFISKIIYGKTVQIGDKTISLVCAFILLSVQGFKIIFPSYSYLVSFPQYIYSAILGILFISMGHLLRKYVYTIPLLVASICVYLSIAFFDFSYVDFHQNRLANGSYFLWIVASVSGILIINNLFYYLYPYFQSKILNYVGTNSMVFFASHFIVGHVIEILCIHPFAIINPYLMIATYFMGFIVIIPIIATFLNKQTRLRFLTGK